ncbi:MAG: cation diffusion facilitator family transporter [Candidatus Manganitrophus sp.]|nr:cation diffusion facilitator family transporter [Candidatus Manganitrophus sp.]
MKKKCRSPPSKSRWKKSRSRGPPIQISSPFRSAPREKSSGTLTLLDRTPQPFIRQDLGLLVAIGNQIGVAVENIRLYEETKKVDQLKSDFVSKVSHEFRTPLTSIKGFIEILLSYEDIAAEKQQEFLQIINQESDRLIRLINDVLDISKIEAGKIAWKVEPLDLVELIDSTVRATHSLIDAKKIALLVEVEPELPPVLGDRDHLIQVLNNLLSNAIKFTERGQIALFARRSGENEILAGVRDTGIGLPQSETTKIFNKFYQVARPEKGLPKGTGLGTGDLPRDHSPSQRENLVRERARRRMHLLFHPPDGGAPAGTGNGTLSLLRSKRKPCKPTMPKNIEMNTGQVKKILIVILGLNLLTALAKSVWGYWTESISMQADGFHSFLDAASNLIGLVGVWFASRPPDDTHPYGHRKFETFASFCISVFLFLGCFEILKEQLHPISGRNHPRGDGDEFRNHDPDNRDEHLDQPMGEKEKGISSKAKS